MSDITLDSGATFADPTPAKWSQRQTVWFVIASSTALWSGIIWGLWQLF